MFLKRSVSVLTMLAAFCILSGCAAHKTEPKPQGFLGDYSKLKPGDDTQAGLVWIQPGLNPKNYDAIVVDRMQTWIKPDTTFKNVNAEDLNELVNYCSSTLAKEVAQVMPITPKPGPRVLVLRSALTDIVPGEPVSGTLSSIVPVGIVASGATQAVTGSGIGVGESSIETELLDGHTGQRLAAAVDRRAGTKAPFRGSMQDAQDACDYWAKLIAKRLAEFKAGTLKNK